MPDKGCLIEQTWTIYANEYNDQHHSTAVRARPLQCCDNWMAEGKEGSSGRGWISRQRQERAIVDVTVRQGDASSVSSRRGLFAEHLRGVHPLQRGQK